VIWNEVFYAQKEYARQRGNQRREDAKSGMGNQEELFIRIKAFNGGGGKKTPLIPMNDPYTRGHDS